MEQRRTREPARNASGIETRARILRSAGRVFAQKGYAGASFRALAKDSGVGLSNIVYYFPSKHALFLETIRHFTLELGKLNEHFVPLFSVDRGDKQAVADALQATIHSFLKACHGSAGVQQLNELYIRVIAEGDKKALGMLFECFADVQERLRGLVVELRPDFSPMEVGFFQQLLWSLLQYTVVGKRLVLYDMELKDYTEEYLFVASVQFARYCAGALGLPEPRAAKAG